MNQEKPGKQKIEETLIRMSETTSIEKINVTALVRECGISRTIFYYYFQDIYDALEDYISTNMEELISECIAIEDPAQSIRHFTERYYMIFPMLQRILHTKYYEEAERLMIRVSKKYFRLILNKKAHDLQLVPEDVDFIIDFFASGITAYAFEHCERNDSDPEIMARNLICGITMFTDSRRC